MMSRIVAAYRRDRVSQILSIVALFVVMGGSVTTSADYLWGGDPVVLAVGDIAGCPGQQMHEATARLLDGLKGPILVLGDIAYESGTPREFAECYDPSWGRHKSRIYPSPGNHEYRTPGAAGYFGYFGAAAGDPEKGYYSFDLGSWHIVSLNSNCNDGWDPDGCRVGSAQVQWLRADLDANPRRCTLAFFHHPLFSSSVYADDLTTFDIWQTLYEYGVDVALVGHEHFYERFAIQDPFGQADPHGIRQIIVGTGGIDFTTIHARARNSEVVNNTSYGVLRMTLNETSYSWEFIPIEGHTFQDVGSSECSDGPNSPPTFQAQKSDLVLDGHPVGYWRLNDGSGATALDAAGRANGTYTDVRLGADGPRAGADNLVGEFDGVRSRVVVGDRYDFPDRQPFSFEVSVYPLAADDGYRRILSKDAYASPANRGWALTHNRNGLTFFRFDGKGVGNQATAPPLPVNEWSHIIGTYDGTTMRLYRNGVRVASANSPVSLPDLAEPFTIGASATGSAYFHGRIGDVAIYDYALAPAQLRWLAYATGSLQPPAPARPSSERQP